VLGLTACSGATGDTPTPSDTTITSTVTATRSAKPTYVPPPATTVPPLPPNLKPPKGEKARLCPYIRSGKDMDPTTLPNVADIVGSRVVQTTVITTTKPVGCRFYFWGPYYAIADIVPKTFANPTDAHNAMVLTAEAGKQARGVHLLPGVDGVLFLTKFYGPDGLDWACAFAKGNVMVVVRTAHKADEQSVSAVDLAKAVAKKF